MRRVFADARRFFRVESAGRADGLDAAARAAFAQDLALATQKREAARQLMLHGARAEALALAAQALSHARAAAARVDPAELPSEASAPADALARALEAEPFPALDEAVRPAHDDLFEDVLYATLGLESELLDATLTPRAAATLRWLRPTLVALLVVAVSTATFLVLRKRPYVVEASATAEPALIADHLIDHDDKTEWALPDRTPGHVDVIMSKPRAVQRLKLLNSKNLPSGERGTREFRVEVYAGGKLEKSVDGAFAAWSREPQWQTIELGVGGVQRIRVVVKTWFGAGGGLTEIVVE